MAKKHEIKFHIGMDADTSGVDAATKSAQKAEKAMRNLGEAAKEADKAVAVKAKVVVDDADAKKKIEAADKAKSYTQEVKIAVKRTGDDKPVEIVGEKQKADVVDAAVAARDAARNLSKAATGKDALDGMGASVGRISRALADASRLDLDEVVTGWADLNAEIAMTEETDLASVKAETEALAATVEAFIAKAADARAQATKATAPAKAKIEVEADASKAEAAVDAVKAEAEKAVVTPVKAEIGQNVEGRGATVAPKTYNGAQERDVADLPKAKQVVERTAEGPEDPDKASQEVVRTATDAPSPATTTQEVERTATDVPAPTPTTQDVERRAANELPDPSPTTQKVERTATDAPNEEVVVQSRVKLDTAEFDAFVARAEEGVEVNAVIGPVDLPAKTGDNKVTLGVDADAEDAEDAVDAVKERANKPPAIMRVEATTQGLVNAIDELSAKAGQFGTAVGNEIQQTLDGFRKAVEGGTVDGTVFDESTMKGLAGFLGKLLTQTENIKPDGLVRINKEIKKVGAAYEEFSDAVQDALKIKLSVEATGIDKMELLNERIEKIKSARGLEEGITRMSAALKNVDPSKAKEANGHLSRMKELLSGELNAQSLAKINEENDKLRKSMQGMSAKEMEKFGPVLQDIDKSVSNLRQNVDSAGESLRRGFDPNEIPTQIVNGDVNGLITSLFRLAAGARITGTALKNMLKATAIGLAIEGFSKIVEFSKALFFYWSGIERKVETELNQIEALGQATESANSILAKRMEIYDRNAEMAKKELEIEKEQADAVRATEKAQRDLMKTRAAMSAVSANERFYAEQNAKEADDQSNYEEQTQALDVEARRNAVETKNAEDKLKAAKEALAKAQELGKQITDAQNQYADFGYFGEAASQWGLNAGEKGLKQLTEKADENNKAIESAAQTIKALEGVIVGGEKLTKGQLDVLAEERKTIEERRRTVDAQKKATDEENRLARVEQARSMRMAKYNRDEQIAREEYDINEQQRQYAREQANEEAGYAMKAEDAKKEVARWQTEENDEDATVKEIRAKYADKIGKAADDEYNRLYWKKQEAEKAMSSGSATEEEKAKLAEEIASITVEMQKVKDTTKTLAELNKKDADITAKFQSGSMGESEQRALLEEQMKVQDRIAEIEAKYYKEMSDVDAQRLSNAINYRNAARSQRFAAQSAQKALERELRRAEEDRLHAVEKERKDYEREAKYNAETDEGRRAMDERMQAEYSRIYNDLDEKIRASNEGRGPKMTRDEQYQAERQRQEAYDYMTGARGRLAQDDLRRRDVKMENEQRTHQYKMADEEFERDQRRKRASYEGRMAIEHEQLARGRREYADSDVLIRAQENGGKLNLTRQQRAEYEARVNANPMDEAAKRIIQVANGAKIGVEELAVLKRTRDESRIRIESARSAIADMKYEGDEKELAYREKLKPQNRLTQMGLGGNVSSWGTKTAENTKSLVGITRQMLSAMTKQNPEGGRRAGTVRWSR